MLRKMLLMGWVGLSAAPAFAGRCTYNPDLNTIQCCAAGKQALFHPTLHRLECLTSDTGESCLFNPSLNTISCCDRDQQAVWHETLNRYFCCDPQGSNESC